MLKLKLTLGHRPGFAAQILDVRQRPYLSEDKQH